MISDVTKLAIRRRGLITLCKQIIKSLLFYLVTLTALFVTESNNYVFTREKQPIWFWGIFVILLLIPIIRYKFYLLPFTLGTYGHIEKIKSGNGMAPRRDRAVGIRGFWEGNMEHVVSYRITVKTNRGISLNFLFMREDAEFAMGYYREGDAVYLPPFAKYPYNLDRLPDRRFCFACGGFGMAHKDTCPLCGVPFDTRSSLHHSQEQ